MEKLDRAFWVWCEFSVIDLDYLTRIKNKVQLKLKCPKFKSHLTLAGPFNEINELSIQEIRAFCDQQPTFNIYPLRYEHGQEFFKSVFITIAESKELNSIRNTIFKINNLDATNNFTPHISLTYGNHEKRIKENLIPSLPNLKDSITINKISIVEIQEKISLWKIYFI